MEMKLDRTPDAQIMARHLAGMIPFRTIAYREQEQTDGAPFLALHEYLENTYPLVHRTLEKEIIADYSLLYRWPGTDSAKQPVLFMAHQDVVPVPQETLDQWDQPPFDGKIADGMVWGRGALDCKNMLCCELEAVEALLEQGYTPTRDIYLAFGHDEESGGFNGMTAVARTLKERGVTLSFVLDEGSGYVAGEERHCPGQPLAEVGVFEKGYLDLQLTVQSEGGHASRPGATTALGRLARAISAVENAQFPLSLPQPVKWTFQALTPYLEAGELKRCVETMEQTPEPLVALLSRTAKGNAMVRTTIAPTMASASDRPNVLPTQAQAVINFRLNPDTDREIVLRRCEKAIGDPQVALTVLRAEEPSRITPIDSQAYRTLCEVIGQIRPGCAVVPVAVLGATDSRKFEEICAHIFRFTPLYTQGLGHTVHGVNEAMPVDALPEGAAFFMALIRRVAG